MLPLLKDRWVYPDGRYLETKPCKSALSDSPGGKLKNKCKKKKGAPAMAVGVLTAIGKGWFVHKLHIYYKMQKRDGNSINICGGCRSSLRWAAICRLISGGYIIEIFLLFFPSPISISWRKCKPEASNWDGFVYIYQQYIVRELWKMPLVIFFFFLFFCAMDPRKIAVGIDDTSWFVCLFIYYLNLSFFKWSLKNKQKDGHLCEVCEAVRCKTIR